MTRPRRPTSPGCPGEECKARSAYPQPENSSDEQRSVQPRPGLPFRDLLNDFPCPDKTAPLALSTPEEKPAMGRRNGLPARGSRTGSGSWRAPWHARSPGSWRAPRRDHSPGDRRGSQRAGRAHETRSDVGRIERPEPDREGGQGRRGTRSLVLWGFVVKAHACGASRASGQPDLCDPAASAQFR